MKIAESSSGARNLGPGSADLPSPLLGTLLSYSTLQTFSPLPEKRSIVVNGGLYNMHDNNIIHK